MEERFVAVVIYALPALLLGVVGVLFCKGKAGFLLAGWNTMPKEKSKAGTKNACCTLMAGAF